AYGETGFNPGEEGETLTVDETPGTDLENLDCQTSYEVYVRSICGDDNYSDWAGPVEFTTACAAPVEFTADQIAADSAEMSWTETCSADTWEILYGPKDFDPETEGQSVVVEGDPVYTLEDLEPNTDYDVYVRAVCNENQYSDW